MSMNEISFFTGRRKNGGKTLESEAMRLAALKAKRSGEIPVLLVRKGAKIRVPGSDGRGWAASGKSA